MFHQIAIRGLSNFMIEFVMVTGKRTYYALCFLLLFLLYFAGFIFHSMSTDIIET